MHNSEIADRLRKIMRQELADCETAIRSRDPVRALNDLADASKALKSLIRSLAPERDDDQCPSSEPQPDKTEPD